MRKTTIVGIIALLMLVGYQSAQAQIQDEQAGDKHASSAKYASVTNTPPFIVTLETKDKVPVWVDAPGLTEFMIAMPDREIAERVQTAFKHAVELAKKQKKEPF